MMAQNNGTSNLIERLIERLAFPVDTDSKPVAQTPATGASIDNKATLVPTGSAGSKDGLLLQF
jgi:hypothetical protein